MGPSNRLGRVLVRPSCGGVDAHARVRENVSRKDTCSAGVQQDCLFFFILTPVGWCGSLMPTQTEHGWGCSSLCAPGCLLSDRPCRRMWAGGGSKCEAHEGLHVAVPCSSDGSGVWSGRFCGAFVGGGGPGRGQPDTEALAPSSVQVRFCSHFYKFTNFRLGLKN